jgi:hemolysin III
MVHMTPLENRLNVISQVAGLVLSGVAMVLLVARAYAFGALYVASVGIFGLSLMMLYTSSTFYHKAKEGPLKNRLKIIDHSFIYFLIASTYTPFTILVLDNKIGWIIFGISWGMAITGMILKLFFTGKYHLLSTIMYVLMGWIIVFTLKPMINQFSLDGLLWLFFGGVSYTVGALVHSLKNIRFKYFIFHLFVLGGNFCHFISVYFYVLYR